MPTNLCVFVLLWTVAFACEQNQAASGSCNAYKQFEYSDLSQNTANQINKEAAESGECAKQMCFFGFMYPILSTKEKNAFIDVLQSNLGDPPAISENAELKQMSFCSDTPSVLLCASECLHFTSDKCIDQTKWTETTQMACASSKAVSLLDQPGCQGRSSTNIQRLKININQKSADLWNDKNLLNSLFPYVAHFFDWELMQVRPYSVQNIAQDQNVFFYFFAENDENGRFWSGNAFYHSKSMDQLVKKITFYIAEYIPNINFENVIIELSVQERQQSEWNDVETVRKTFFCKKPPKLSMCFAYENEFFHELLDNTALQINNYAKSVNEENGCNKHGMACFYLFMYPSFSSQQHDSESLQQYFG